MLSITKEQVATAQELGRKHKASAMYVNDKGEHFTDVQHAKASVNGDVEKYAKVDVTAEVKENAGNTKIGKADDLIAAIEAAETAEAVQAIIDAENEGKKRTTVLEAGSKRLETLNTAE